MTDDEKCRRMIAKILLSGDADSASLCRWSLFLLLYYCSNDYPSLGRDIIPIAGGVLVVGTNPPLKLQRMR